MCGFGAMSEEPFFYIFIDEHKIITIRCEPALKEKVERILSAFDLEPLEEKPGKKGAPPTGGPAGADAAAHEHRGVLVTADDRPDLLTEDEIVEQLRDEWRLTLNVDPDSNQDEDGRELGLIPWHCQVRCAAEGDENCRYAEVLLGARTLREAEELALEASEDLKPKDLEEWEEQTVVADSGKLTTTTRTALKFLTRVGADAAFIEQYDSASGKVRDFRAWMIPASGKVKKYGKDEIVDVACAENDVYNECRRRVVSGKRDAYVLRVKGDSMIDEQIRDGDFVIVEDRKTADNGEMVIALLGGLDVTLKKFYRENGRVRLQPANPAMQPMMVDPDQVQVQGVVVGVMRKY